MTFREQISNTLSQYTYPVSVNTIRQELVQGNVPQGSRSTIKKYLEELVAEGLVVRQAVSAERKQKPMTLYSMRGCRPDLRGEMEKHISRKFLQLSKNVYRKLHIN